jgi:hypothetical protein
MEREDEELEEAIGTQIELQEAGAGPESSSAAASTVVVSIDGQTTIGDSVSQVSINADSEPVSFAADSARTDMS